MDLYYMFLHLGGPDGEAGAAMRYLSQRYAMPYKEGKAILTDIGVSLLKLAIIIRKTFSMIL